MEYIALALIMFTSAADAVRDAWIQEGWWKRHIAKWLAFYPPLIFIMVWFTPMFWWPFIIIGAWVVWRLSVRYIGGRRWRSHWFDLDRLDDFLVPLDWGDDD